jgi:hypothetical protein
MWENLQLVPERVNWDEWWDEERQGPQVAALLAAATPRRRNGSLDLAYLERVSAVRSEPVGQEAQSDAREPSFELSDRPRAER